MEFLQPILLWGLLGLAIPILIHLWNGRKGRTISWAAMTWLETKENQPVKSIQLEQLILLLLRVLLIIILVLMLSQIFWKAIAASPENQVLHLVQPSGALLDEYRFELQQALEKGEPVYWLSNELSPVLSIEGEVQKSADQEIDLQKALDRVSDPGTLIHLYLVNSSLNLKAPFYYTFSKTNLHLSQFEELKLPSKKIQLNDDKYLTVNDQNKLEIIENIDMNDSAVVWDQVPITYTIANISEESKPIIEAAFKAIESVYQLSFVPAKDAGTALVVFDYTAPIQPEMDKLYFYFTETQFPQFSNTKLINLNFDQKEESLVNIGQLPEQIFEHIVLHFGLEPNPIALNEFQVQSKFIESEKREEEKQANTQEILWLLFVLTLVAERVISLRKQL